MASLVDCGEQGDAKWDGIAAVGNKLFCAPYCSNLILVIDAQTEAVHATGCGGVTDVCKWSGIAAVGNKLFCAPFSSNLILVIDAQTEAVHTIDCGEQSNCKWSGIAAVGNKLFCAPCNSNLILVIDAQTEAVHTIDCGEQSNRKWRGIAAVGNKLFCAPCNSNLILVIDAQTEAVHTIDCGVTGVCKWSGIAAVGNKLFCAPYCSNLILVIDAQTEAVHTTGCGGVTGDRKWSGITAASNNKLVCAPTCANQLLLLPGPPRTPAQQLAELEATSACVGAAVVARDLGALLDSGDAADVTFCVGEGEGAEEIVAHRAVLTARSPVFATMMAERWGASAVAGAAGALGAMPDHLLDASAAHGMGELHTLSARAMMLSVTAENVCDYFALAHAHEHEDLMDVCAELMDKEMQAVTQSESFKRHMAERSVVAALLFTRMAQLSSPEAQGRKRKRSALSEGDGGSGNGGGGAAAAAAGQ